MLLLNDKPIDYFKFPGGELHVKLPKNLEPKCIKLIWKPTSSDDIMLLLLTVNALNNHGIYDIDLDILYLPYARQDRVCSPREAFSLEVIAGILEKLNVNIKLCDVHNLQKVENLGLPYIYHWELWEIFAAYKIFDDFDLFNLRLCAPDRGAYMKVWDLAHKSDLPSEQIIFFDKERNPENGEIIGLKLNEESPNFDGWNVLVADDICDGGRTFIEVAKKLRESTTENLYLYVTHGIFSKGLDELLKYYKHIICHHVLDDSKFKSNENLTILREFPHAN